VGRVITLQSGGWCRWEGGFARGDWIAAKSSAGVAVALGRADASGGGLRCRFLRWRATGRYWDREQMRSLSTGFDLEAAEVAVRDVSMESLIGGSCVAGRFAGGWACMAVRMAGV